MKKSTSSSFRIEHDALGSVQVPKNAYYGSFTARALAHFQISGQIAPDSFRQALGFVKLAACRTHQKLGNLAPKKAKAMAQASQEFIDGKFNNEFKLDLYQAGAGTPYNMNANEIISNRANEILKAPKGSYRHVHPNNHVNKAQSSNDVIPTAIRLAGLMEMQFLKIEMDLLQKSLSKKGREFKTIFKVGRTHLSDAIPITLGQEFDAYASAITTALETLQESEKSLCILGIGGTAVGTGLNTPPQFSRKITEELAKLTGFSLKSAPNLVETTHSMAAFLKASSALRALAVEVNRMANDLRLLSMGPQAGLAEISLPAAEPGSSIMPGKVNPSIAECMNMICFQVIANDQAVCLGAQGGQLELNWFTPLILANLLPSLNLMTRGLRMFRTQCIDGIKANTKRIKELFENSAVLATALAPHLGYHEVALLVNEALKTDHSIREMVLAKKLLSKKELDRILDPERMIRAK